MQRDNPFFDMFLRTLPLALVLAACSVDAPREKRDPAEGAADTAAPARSAPSRTATPDPTPTPLIAPALADQGPRATPGAPRGFTDWVVGCDNLWTCEAVALGPDTGDYPTLRLVVTRAGGGASPRVTIEANEAVAPPVTIAIDGKRVASGGRADGDAVRFTGEEARRIIAALVDGKQGRLTAGPQVDALSLAGAAAALRFIDDRQRIADTNAALVALGEARPTATPPAAPVLRPVRPAGQPTRPSGAQVDAMRRAADCQIEFLPEERTGPELHALGGGATLILLPCGAGAYNLMSAAFVIGGDGALRPAGFDAETGIDLPVGGIAQLVNAEFAGGRLSTYAKGRGIGDCGITQRFLWDGRRFRLFEQMEMNECRGATHMIRTWRASVID